MLLPLLLAASLLQTAAAPQAPVADEPLAPPTVVYPSEARRERVEGTVTLAVSVDATGRVTEVHALSGPIPLRQAAVDAYAHAIYRPLMRDGRPAPAAITVAVKFSLAELPPDTDLLVSREFTPVHTRCQELSRTHDPAALATCRHAVDITRRFTPGAELEARATAFNDLVLLLIADGKRSPQLPEAGVLAQQAVDLVGSTDPHTPAVALAHITRAEVRSLAGDLPGAAIDCGVAEETLVTLIADQAAPDQQAIDRTANYKGQLRDVYELHAIVLDRAGKHGDAKRIRARASTV